MFLLYASRDVPPYNFHMYEQRVGYWAIIQAIGVTKDL